MRGLLLLPLLLLVPGAHAAFTVSGPDPVLVEIPAGDAPAVVEYSLRIHLDNASGLYLKLVPSPGNPAVLNGTPDADGWWLEARLNGVGGTTNGSVPVRFGTVPAGNHSLALRLHMPPAARTGGHEHRVDVAVAQEAAAGTLGNGGTYHPAQAFALPVRVAEQQASPAEAPESGRSLAPLLIGLGIFIAAGVGLAVLLARRRNG